ncbi:MAG: protoporphyrinogen/coproporphyrinogen oxidase [Candidatus Rokuibacteriota bacterium]
MALTHDPGRVLILGAGPTGLGAALRLQQLGFHDFHVLEAAPSAGGLAASVVDDQGFTWDLGGHVQFSHYGYYDDVLDAALGEEWFWHERESWVWIKGRFVPYPFQNNIHRLDREDMELALRGLERAASSRPAGPAANFGEWIHTTFGEGIAQLFLYPYNFKVWGVPPERMGVTWMGERVAVPDLQRIRRNISELRDDVSWGPNNRFRFPKRGGTGAIWKRVAELISPSRLLFDHRMARVDTAGRTVALANGRTMRYDSLITSVPLDRLAASCDGLTAEARRAARALVHSSVHIVGVGLKGSLPAELGRKCWMYFPEDHNPYYRVTVFSNYSPAHVPDSGRYFSLMAEVCESPYKPVDESSLRDWVLAAMRKDGLIGADADVVSVWHRRVEHGYPTPFLGRDRVLDQLIPALADRRIFARGRFGGWKYEVANQDHSFMQGVELADRLLDGKPETTYFDPVRANSGVFLRG